MGCLSRVWGFPLCHRFKWLAKLKNSLSHNFGNFVWLRGPDIDSDLPAWPSPHVESQLLAKLGVTAIK
jgi:hypothetical protein